jgi:hypothetical protein
MRASVRTGTPARVARSSLLDSAEPDADGCAFGHLASGWHGLRDDRLLDLGQSANTLKNVGCASLILNAKAISVGHPGHSTVRR